MGAVANTESHSFYPLPSESNRSTASSQSNTVLCNTTVSLWKEGIDVSFLPWVPTPNQQPRRHIALPPYQFSRKQMWVHYVYHAVQFKRKAEEAEDTFRDTQSKLQAMETGLMGNGVAPRTPLQAAAADMLVTRRSVDDRDIFAVKVMCPRFHEIVAAHAVRGRDLCPASMYMECTAMALKLCENLAADVPFPAAGMTLEFQDLQSVLSLLPSYLPRPSQAPSWMRPTRASRTVSCRSAGSPSTPASCVCLATPASQLGSSGLSPCLALADCRDQGRHGLCWAGSSSPTKTQRPSKAMYSFWTTRAAL